MNPNDPYGQNTVPGQFGPPYGSPPPPVKWYRTNAGTIILLIFFFPVGLYLMWQYMNWPKNVKWIVTGAIVVIGLCGSISNATSSTQQVAQQVDASPTQQPTTVVVTKVVPTPKTTPTPSPTPIPPTPTPVPQAPVQQPPVQQQPAPHPTGVNGNPWGYDFNPGNLIYSPNADFCSYFTCVSTFWKDTNGYVAECGSGSYTHSGGVSGACSRNGGVKAILYQH